MSSSDSNQTNEDREKNKKDDAENIEMIDVLFNDCYGGFSLSGRATKLYNDRNLLNKKEDKHDSKPLEKYDFYRIKRHDPLLVQIYHELGDGFNSSYSKVKVAKIPKKYSNYYTITDYDGLEGIQINYHKYKADMIKEILNNNMDNDEKIKQIRTIVDEKIIEY